MIQTASTSNDHGCETCAVDSCLPSASDSVSGPGDDGRNISALVASMRENNRTLLHQSERIEELQSVLSCILYLTGIVKTLERENDC